MWAPVNYWAVLGAGVASMVIGSIWYGPLFGKLFSKEKGFDSMAKEKRDQLKKNMWVSYVVQFLASLVMYYVLAGLIVGFDKSTLTGGMLTGLIMWGGFVVPLALGEAIWGGKMSLFWLNIGHMLVNLLAAGAIIGYWK